MLIWFLLILRCFEPLKIFHRPKTTSNFIKKMEIISWHEVRQPPYCMMYAVWVYHVQYMIYWIIEDETTQKDTKQILFTVNHLESLFCIFLILFFMSLQHGIDVTWLFISMFMGILEKVGKNLNFLWSFQKYSCIY